MPSTRVAREMREPRQTEFDSQGQLLLREASGRQLRRLRLTPQPAAAAPASRGPRVVDLVHRIPQDPNRGV